MIYEVSVFPFLEAHINQAACLSFRILMRIEVKPNMFNDV